MKQTFTTFLIGILTFSIAGCATPLKINFLANNSNAIFPPTQKIDVFYERPQKEYIVLGKIIVEPREEWLIWENANITSQEVLFNKFKEKAMSIGADAVWIQSMDERKIGKGLFRHTVNRIEGIALKWVKL